ncbi:protelomerase family protein [Pokkaliibacter sp. CJK22405]|uniref:protelomerase family protein n=1 Tax=Pokkaliibacter sp. CJK22405 TaxID=3384615 RepID=UPI003984E9F9
MNNEKYGELIASMKSFSAGTYESGKDDPATISRRLNDYYRRHLRDSLGVTYKHENVAGRRVLVVEPGEMLSASASSGIIGHCISAIRSLRMKHHLIEKNLGLATRELAPYFDSKTLDLLSPDRDLDSLREDLTRLRKNETRDIPRSLLAGVRIEHHGVYILNDIYRRLRQVATANDKKALGKKLKSQVLVNPTFPVARSQEVLSALSSPDHSYSVPIVAAALAIVTGRRRTEIFKTAEFSTKGAPAGYLRFSGQLKTKDRRLFDNVAPYDIPCLVEPELAVSGLKWLRQQTRNDVVSYIDAAGVAQEGVKVRGKPATDVYHNEAVGQRYGATAGTATRAFFGFAELKFKDLRAMYTEIGYGRFALPGESRSAYRTRVLGHSAGDDEAGSSQQHYEAFTLTDEVETAEAVRAAGRENTGLINYLKRHGGVIEEWARSPAGQRLHDWLLDQAQAGLSAELIDAGWLRKYAIIDGKELNHRTIKTYLEKIQWDENVRATLLEEEKNKAPAAENFEDDQEADEESPDEESPDEALDLEDVSELDDDEDQDDIPAHATEQIIIRTSKRGKYWVAQAFWQGKMRYELQQQGRKDEAEQECRRLAERELLTYKVYTNGGGKRVDILIDDKVVATATGATTMEAGRKAYMTFTAA